MPQDVIDECNKDPVGQVRLERYSSEFDFSKTMDHMVVQEGDIVITSPVLGYGDEFIRPEEYSTLKEALSKADKAVNNSGGACRLCGEADDNPLIYVLQTTGHRECFEAFLSCAETLLKRNPNIATSESI